MVMSNPYIKDIGKKITFMPDATRGAVRYLTANQLRSTGTKNIVVNTLHLLMNPGPEKIEKLGGIHEFMNWHEGWILSDSGGYQIYSLVYQKRWNAHIDENGAYFKSPVDGKVHVLTPETSVEIQLALGADIVVTLDDCVNQFSDRDVSKRAMDRSLRWSQRALDHFKRLGGHEKGSIIAGVVQGSNHLDLREYSSKEMSKMDFDGYNIGGTVADIDGNLVLDEMKVVIDNTPKDKFKYAMGVGKPEDVIAASKLGYTLFDTVLVTRNARHGTLFSFDSEDYRLRIKNARYALDQTPIDSTCDCEACTKHSRAYIHHLLRVGEATGMALATVHNLRFYQRLVDKLNNGEL